MSIRDLETRIKVVGKSVGAISPHPTAALVDQVLESPIQVLEPPPSFSKKISWWERSFGLLSLMPPCLQSALAVRPAALESAIGQIFQHLTRLDKQNQATQLSGQHVKQFGLPMLQPGQAEVFSQVVAVADQLGETHERLMTSNRQEARTARESLNLIQSLVFWIYEKTIELLTDLLAEQARLRKTEKDLQVDSVYQTVIYNHDTVGPQVRPKLDLVTKEINQLEKYLEYLRHVGQDLSSAMQLPENALRQMMAVPTVVGGRTN